MGRVLFCICRSSRAVGVSDKGDDATSGYMCFRRSLSDRFRTSAENVAPEENHDIPAARVFSILAAVTGMHLKSQNQSEPFGPMVVSAEGRRTAAPRDFRGEPVAVLSEMAARAEHPVLRARLADVSWLLERKRAQLMVASSHFATITSQAR
jgi:hypothetical protein